MAQNIGEFLTNRARRDTDLEAIYEPATDNRLSYRELNENFVKVCPNFPLAQSKETSFPPVMITGL